MKTKQSKNVLHRRKKSDDIIIALSASRKNQSKSYLVSIIAQWSDYNYKQYISSPFSELLFSLPHCKQGLVGPLELRPEFVHSGRRRRRFGVGRLPVKVDERAGATRLVVVERGSNLVAPWWTLGTRAGCCAQPGSRPGYRYNWPWKIRKMIFSSHLIKIMSIWFSF